MAPMLAAEGLGLMVWSPLASGYLSGKYRRGARHVCGDDCLGLAASPAHGDQYHYRH